MIGMSACNGEECKIKETCYRYTMKKHPDWQSYIKGKYDEKISKCIWFISNEKLKK